jgi:hydrogenase expression/formation protein HypD
MRFVEDYRKKEDITAIAGRIHRLSKKPVTLMEVCGGHTMAIHKFGLLSLLPETVNLLSGPGCPVCVTSRSFIDKAIAYAGIPGMIITTYGDLIRVPGSQTSLETEKASGNDIRIVYSVLEAIGIARQNPGKNVIFLGIGFETTAPLSAAAILRAKKENIRNFFLFSAHKVMPPVMEALVRDGVSLHGFIAPGHVSAITGAKIFQGLPQNHGLGVVVAGFEPVDIMQSVWMLVKQIESGKPAVEIEYKRVVSFEGNLKAQQMLGEVFETADSGWRGLGMIPESGLKLRKEFSDMDAETVFPLIIPDAGEPKGCICGEILKGRKNPGNCSLFRTTCTPETPVGACMVSSEGACATWFKYHAS